MEIAVAQAGGTHSDADLPRTDVIDLDIFDGHVPGLLAKYRATDGRGHRCCDRSRWAIARMLA
jgi:hypothetical protein